MRGFTFVLRLADGSGMMFKKSLAILMLIMAAAFCADAGAATDHEHPSVWYTKDSSDNHQVSLYFFWSKQCPHCLTALPDMKQLARTYAWVTLHSLELTEHPENAKRYSDMAAHLGMRAESVPAFLFCGTMMVGYDGSESTGEFLHQRLLECRAHLQGGRPLSEWTRGGHAGIDIPLLGDVDPADVSLPLLTLTLAGLDAFNPCAFFVLLFLLSLLVHAQSRTRMLLVGGTFVFFSGLMYFVFMSAWLNVFLIIGHLSWITLMAGAVAVVVASINIKDYFWFKAGVSLTIPERAKPGLFQRMRRLVSARGLVSVLVGTVGLALFANAYEFLCTAGFPMVFTRILTLQESTEARQYLYLLFYNIIYVIPLALIVVVFTFTLGARKLREEEGRILKLSSGLMMLGLGIVLMAVPEWLNNLMTALVLLALTIATTAAIVVIDRMRGKAPADRT